jgi:hypothetical protein
MSGVSLTNTDHIVRSELWSTQIKEPLLDELMGLKYVEMVTDFPDGNLINIPSIGQMEVRDYDEGQEVVYTSLDTGNYTFSIDKYQSSATYITNKMKQDSFYADRIAAQFVPSQQRAIAVAMETNLLSKPNAGQTASDLNTINGAHHRYVASGTNAVMTITDILRARYALRKANVPLTNLVGIVDPSVAMSFATQPNLLSMVSNNPAWDKVIVDGMTSGMRFVVNIAGFDIYESNYLPSGITETIDSVSVSGGNGVANYFFSAAPGVTPLVGLVRQAPTVESEYNKDKQREEYLTICRYGFGFYRPENMVTVLTQTNQVYA